MDVVKNTIGIGLLQPEFSKSISSASSVLAIQVDSTTASDCKSDTLAAETAVLAQLLREAVPFTCSIEKSCGPETGKEPGATGIILGGVVGNEEEGEWNLWAELRAVRCKSGACKKCGACKAYKTAKRLEPALKKMLYPRMYTFTLVPGQWAGGAEEAYEYCKIKRVIGELVRTLFEQGHLNSHHYFCAEEFQVGERLEDGSEPTGFVHFHVLLDVKGGYLDHRVVQARWDLFIKPNAIKLGDWRDTTFGRVRYDEIDNVEGIAKYVCKYIAKGPKHGLPDWFDKRIDSGKNIMGYSTSKYFWSEMAGEPVKQKKKQANEDLKKEKERARDEKKQEMEAENLGLRPDVLGKRKKKKRKPWKQRLAECCQRAKVVLVRGYKVPGVEGFTKKEVQHVGELKASFEQVVTAFRLNEDEFRKGAVKISGDFKSVAQVRQDLVVMVDHAIEAGHNSRFLDVALRTKKPVHLEAYEPELEYEKRPDWVQQDIANMVAKAELSSTGKPEANYSDDGKVINLEPDNLEALYRFYEKIENVKDFAGI